MQNVNACKMAMYYRFFLLVFYPTYVQSLVQNEN